MKLCRKCNVTYDNDEICFCYKCGSKLDNVNICPKCHTENNLDFAFCAKCGTKLNDNNGSLASAMVSPVQINEKSRNITSNDNYQYNTTVKDTDSDSIFDNPVTLIMTIILAIVVLTFLASSN